MWKSFKEFAFKGNVVDMAVGVMVGGAFGKIVTSLVNDLCMPLLGILTGKMDFAELFIALDGNTYESLAAAKEAGANVLTYGAFISTVVDFFLIVISVFLFVYLIKKMRERLAKKEEPAAEAKPARLCPFCKGEIHDEAVRCPHCTSVLE